MPGGAAKPSRMYSFSSPTKRSLAAHGGPVFVVPASVRIPRVGSPCPAVSWHKVGAKMAVELPVSSRIRTGLFSADRNQRRVVAPRVLGLRGDRPRLGVEVCGGRGARGFLFLPAWGLRLSGADRRGIKAGDAGCADVSARGRGARGFLFIPAWGFRLSRADWCGFKAGDARCAGAAVGRRGWGGSHVEP